MRGPSADQQTCSNQQLTHAAQIINHAGTFWGVDLSSNSAKRRLLGTDKLSANLSGSISWPNQKCTSVTDSRLKSFNMPYGSIIDSTWVTATSKTWYAEERSLNRTLCRQPKPHEPYRSASGVSSRRVTLRVFRGGDCAGANGLCPDQRTLKIHSPSLQIVSAWKGKKMVGPQGLEPQTNGLWVRYTTMQLIFWYELSRY